MDEQEIAREYDYIVYGPSHSACTCEYCQEERARNLAADHPARVRWETTKELTVGSEYNRLWRLCHEDPSWSDRQPHNYLMPILKKWDALDVPAIEEDSYDAGNCDVTKVFARWCFRRKTWVTLQDICDASMKTRRNGDGYLCYETWGWDYGHNINCGALYALAQHNTYLRALQAYGAQQAF